MEKIGDIKFNILLDDSDITDGIRSGLILIKEFKRKADQLLTLKINLDTGDLLKDLNEINSSFGKISSGSEILKIALMGLQSRAQLLRGQLAPTVELFGAFFSIMQHLPREARILAGALTIVIALLAALGVETTIATGGLNLLFAAITTGVALIISGFSDGEKDLKKLRAEVESSLSSLSGYSSTLDQVSRAKTLLAKQTRLTSAEEQELNNVILTLSSQYPNLITSIDEHTGALTINEEALDGVILKQNTMAGLTLSTEIRNNADQLDELSETVFENARALQELQEEERKNIMHLTNTEDAMERLGEITDENRNSYLKLSGKVQQFSEDLQETQAEINLLEGASMSAVDTATLMVSEYLKFDRIDELLDQLTVSFGNNSKAAQLVYMALGNLKAEGFAAIEGINVGLVRHSDVFKRYADVWNKFITAVTSGNRDAVVALYQELVGAVQELKQESSNLDAKVKKRSNVGSGPRKIRIDEPVRQSEDLFEKRLKELKLEYESFLEFEGEKGYSAIKIIDELKKLWETAASEPDEIKRKEKELALQKEIKKLEETLYSKSKKSEIPAFRESFTADIADYSKLYQETNEEISRKNIELIEYEFERKEKLLESERKNRIAEIKKSGATSQQKEELTQQTNKEFERNKSNLTIEKTKAIVSETFNAATGIASILNVGAHTFVGHLLSGLQQGLSLADSLSNLLMLVFKVGSGGGGFFSLLGNIFGFAEGGRVPGSGSGDTVPAMLTPGEFVIRKSVVDKMGSSFFAWINGGLLPSMAGHYAMGGVVSPTPSPVVNNSFDIHIDRRGDVHVVKKALQKIKSNNKYFGG